MNVQNEKMAGQKELAPPSTPGDTLAVEKGSSNFAINSIVEQTATLQGEIQYTNIKMDSLPI